MKRLSLMAVLALPVGALVAAPDGAQAAVRPASHARILVNLPTGQGENPENVVAAGHGFFDATLNQAGRVVRISPTGQVTTLAQLPAGAHAMGITRTPQGALFIAVGGNVAALQGVWQIQPGAPVRVAAMPTPGFPNGISSAADGTLYVTDSTAGTIYKLAPGASALTSWIQAPALAATSRLGVNGIKVHRDKRGNAVYVSNTDAGTLVRVAVTADGSAGGAVVTAKGITGIDDFDFVPGTDTAVAAGNSADTVSLVSPAGRVFPILGRVDGLAGPTSISAGTSSITVMNADYSRGADPSVLQAALATLPADTRR